MVEIVYPALCVFVPRINENLLKKARCCECVELSVHEATHRKVIRPHDMLQNYGKQIDRKVHEASHSVYTLWHGE